MCHLLGPVQHTKELRCSARAGAAVVGGYPPPTNRHHYFSVCDGHHHNSLLLGLNLVLDRASERERSYMDQSKEEFLERFCILAHGLNNGLGVIAGNCELLSEQAKPDSECEKRLRVILDMVQRLAKRINGPDCRFVAGRHAARAATAEQPNGTGPQFD